MTFEEMRGLIPQYLSGELSPSERKDFEAQLNTSAELRIEVEELRALWKDLGALPQEQPSEALRARFYQKLNAVSRDRHRSWSGEFVWWKPGLQGLVRQAGLAAVIFALGLFVGRGNFGSHASNSEVKQLDTEVQSLRRTVALSLLERQSAASRLEGITWTSRVQRPDQDLIDALLTTLNGDPNTNVRLAALDALEKFTNEDGVRKALVESIPRQDSPLVQIGLIDAVVHMRDSAAGPELQKLSHDAQANAAVRERAQWGLEKLSFQ